MAHRIRTALLALLTAGCAAGLTGPAPEYDLLVRNGTVYDGTGTPGVAADVAVKDGRIVAVGPLSGARAREEVDARGLAVAPGFINVLSWATESLIADGRALSDVKQGVTLEIFGEGWSMGPLNEAMKREAVAEQADIKYDIAWTTLGEYLEYLEQRGVSVNVASFVGATTVRIHELGHANRAPTAAELKRMQDLVRRAMAEGALGVGSSLIYAPASYAKTAELKALVAAAAESGGGYISHMRSEGDRFLDALSELIDIARATGAHAEVYHLKAAGRDNWPKMRQAIERIERARKEGVRVSADMYPYPAGATGLDACMDPALKEGGTDAWIKRLRRPDVRRKVVAQMWRRASGWENLCHAAGSPERVMVVGFKNDALKPLTGKTLAEVAKLRGTTPAEAVVDLVVEDHTRVVTVFFLMSEENVTLGLSQPWVSLGSDAEALAAEGVFLKSNPHPRAYGTFARFLGKYVRDEKVATLADGIRRLTSLPAENFKLRDRGRLAAGHHADIVVFDPAAIADRATFEQPHQLATGVRHVWVNGAQVLRDGAHTGAKPGRVVRGPGYKAGATPSAWGDVALARARALLQEDAILVDGHNDLPWQIRKEKDAPGDVAAYDLRGKVSGQTDLKRLREGGVGAQFWSVYTPGEGRNLAATQLEQIDLARRMIARYPEALRLTGTVAEVRAARKDGRIASLLGIEGGHAIENSLGALRAYYDLGVRYMTLTHNVNTAWADAAADLPAKHGGLTRFGEQVVREMNRLGMLIDLSHTSVATMDDALRVSRAPVIWSHSNAQAVCNVPRNVPDAILRRLPQNGGVVMVSFVAGFVDPEVAKVMQPAIDEFNRRAKLTKSEAELQQLFDEFAKLKIPSTTIARVADHIDHIRRVAGVAHIGIGADFDGNDRWPVGLTDVSMYPNLFAELIRRGWSDADLKLVAGENVLRALARAEAVAAELQKTMPPSTARLAE
jgi:N-acyl-D-amino-acid deacylase